MADLKEKCPNCGGTIVVENSDFGVCDSCESTFTLIELQRIKENQNISRYYDADDSENDSHGSAFDINGVEELSVNVLCQKTETALATERWDLVNFFSNEILRREPTFAKAYLYKMLADLKIYRKEELVNQKTPFDKNSNYRLFVRFADVYQKTEIEGYLTLVKEKSHSLFLESTYNNALERMKKANTNADFSIAAEDFKKIIDYKNSKELYDKCILESNKIIAFQKKKRRVNNFIPLLKRAVILLLVVAVIASIVLLITSKNATYSTEHFEVKITEKRDFGGSMPYTTFYIDVKNNSKYDINRIEGFLTIQDKSGKVLDKGEIFLTGNIKSQSADSFALDWEPSGSNSSLEIVNSELDELVVLFRITEIELNELAAISSKKYKDEKDVVIN